MTSDTAAEVRDCLERLDSADLEERRKAASRLADLGVWTRGSVRPRGKLTEAGRNRLPDPESMPQLIRHLDDEDIDVRRQTGAAVGEWGGEAAAETLARKIELEPDEETKLYFVGALRTIGGVTGVKGLEAALAQPSESVRDAAIGGIADLISGGAVDDTEDPLSEIPLSDEDERRHGAVPISGGPARTVAPPDSISNIVNALDEIRTDQKASRYLRERASYVADRLARRRQ